MPSGGRPGRLPRVDTPTRPQATRECAAKCYVVIDFLTASDTRDFMATIDIKRPHQLSKEDARKKAEELAKNLESKIGIKWQWDGDAIKFETPAGAAQGTKGQVLVSDTDVRVEIDLPFLLRVMKGTIESRV